MLVLTLTIHATYSAAEPQWIFTPLEQASMDYLLDARIATDIPDCSSDQSTYLCGQSQQASSGSAKAPEGVS